MNRIALCTLLLTLAPLGAVAERSFTLVGPKGGVSEGVVDCERAAETITCDRSATGTTAGGVVLDRDADRVITREDNMVTITTTGEAGRKITVTRLRER